MAGTIKKLVGPVALTNVYTTNVFNDASALLYSIVRHIHVVNKTAAAVSFRLYLGVTGGNAAGTELFYDQTVPAYGTFDYYCAMKMTSADFLVGGASAATSLSIVVEGEQVVV
jgi:hypothetical protein